MIDGLVLVVLLAAHFGAFDLVKPVAPTQVAIESLTPQQWSTNRTIAGEPPVPERPAPLPAPAPAPVPEKQQEKETNQQR